MTSFKSVMLSAIHDVLREMNFGNCVLPPEIQALERGQKLIINIKLLSLVSPQQIWGQLQEDGLKFYQKE